MIEIEKFQQAISDVLARTRYDKGLSAPTVAKKAGVNNMTVYKYELNKIPRMSLTTLLCLLDGLDIDVVDFFEQVSAFTQGKE